MTASRAGYEPYQLPPKGMVMELGDMTEITLRGGASERRRRKRGFWDDSVLFGGAVVRAFASVVASVRIFATE